MKMNYTSQQGALVLYRQKKQSISFLFAYHQQFRA